MADDLTINNWLKDNFGKSYDNRPIYRVIWSTGLTEKRFGEFNDFVPGTDILLRRYKGVREVSKYPFAKDRWVLEKLVYVGDNTELMEKSGYEPIFVFQTQQGKFLPLNQRATAFAMYYHINNNRVAGLAEMEEAEKAKYKAEVEYFNDYFKDQMSDPNQMDLVE